MLIVGRKAMGADGAATIAHEDQEAPGQPHSLWWPKWRHRRPKIDFLRSHGGLEVEICGDWGFQGTTMEYDKDILLIVNF